MCTKTAARIKALIAGASRWLCEKLCRDKFFNRDASLAIDRLTIELEKIRAGGKKCRPTI